ncbi:MAG TPA: hypothetical protein PLF13_12160 [candidate division Zixibacteria bacterium]|nr:hypothetical protein [candidate division Zixibacteria bacterium]
MHTDVEPPGQCPVCAAPSGKFSEYFGDLDADDTDMDDGLDDFDRDLFADFDDE